MRLGRHERRRRSGMSERERTMRTATVSLHKKRLAMFCWALGLAAMACSPASAGCDSRPGTPDQVRMAARSADSLEASWRNTTGRRVQIRTGVFPVPHALPNFENRMWFDMYLHHGDGRPTGKNLTGTGPYNVSYGSRSSKTFNGLAANTRYCFALRARTAGGTQGCVSGATSNWACATTMAAR
jgi:hypothetical protein